MEIKTYEMHGRRMMVEFECRRCKKTEARSLEECMKEVSEGFNGLHDLKPPKGWRDGGFYCPLFCPQCAEKYDLFMSRKGGE